jgi:hypothetical protein
LGIGVFLAEPAAEPAFLVSTWATLLIPLCVFFSGFAEGFVCCLVVG